MWRSFHSWIGLGLSLLVMVTAITGMILATEPMYESATTRGQSNDQSVADLIRIISVANPDVAGERLQRTETGAIKFTYAQNNRRAHRFVDPVTGIFEPERKRAALYLFARDLHRSFLLGDDGRILTAISGLAMSILTITGLILLLRRLGGVRQFFAPIQGRDAGGIHALVGRLSLIPLLIVCITALYLSALTFDILEASSGRAPAYPESLQELDPVAPWDLHGLQAISLNDVDDVIFPIPEDWFDVWTVKTNTAYVFFDQFTGDELSRDPLELSSIIYDWMVLLHTAQGVWPWALVLLIASAMVPLFSVTGVMIWLRNRSQGRGRIRNNASLTSAEIIIMVGSEGNATWGFAKALHTALHNAGKPVRLAAMNDLRKTLPSAKLLLCLASTYGDGDPPKSATKFLSKLKKSNIAHIDHVTLAFGDKAFPHFCSYAHEVNDALSAKLGAAKLPIFEIDKQSAQSFRDWCGQLSDAINLPLNVRYERKRPKTNTLNLIKHHLNGTAVNAPTAILRFEAQKMPAHRPGDLVEIYPPNSAIPRLYSLGSSSSADGFLEIVVKRVEGGLCSNYLCDLKIGDAIEVSIARNERFQMPRSKPVIMVGAGTGIAPFTGMIRHAKPRQGVDLFWGGRHPEKDALYADEITEWLDGKQLTNFGPAWSRDDPKTYVQDRIRADGAHLVERLKAGATIMVCGGTEMATAVRNEIDILAAEVGLSAKELKRRNRYLEDVY